MRVQSRTIVRCMQTGALILLVGLTGFLATLEAIVLPIAVDGLPSHTVQVRLSVARYYWHQGERWHSLQTLGEAGAQIWVSGIRWKAAQVYWSLSEVLEALGKNRQSRQLCQTAIAVLEYGRYAHTQNGTSTVARACEPDPEPQT
jgi:hypothetical protein